MALSLCCVSEMQQTIRNKYLKVYAEHNTFDYRTYNMHMTCENSVVTSNLYKKSSHFALF